MMHGLIRRRKLDSSGCLKGIGELPSGYQDRMYRGQDGTGSRTKGRIQIFLVCVFIVLSISTPLIFPSLENIREKPWYFPSIGLVILETVFRVTDLTLLPYPEKEVTRLAKMSVVELKNLSNDDLKKHSQADKSRRLD